MFTYYYSRWGWEFFPGIDLGIRIIDNLKFYGTLGRSFRVPSYTEYYFDKAGIKGNPKCKPAEAISYEMGLKYFNRVFSSTLSGYRREGKNVIDWLIDNSDNTQTVESREININGLEIEFNLFPKKLLKNVPFSKIFLQYSYLESDFDQKEGYSSKYLENPLNHQFVFGLAYNYLSWLDQSWRIKYEKRMKQDGYVLIGTKLNLQIWESILFFEVTNLLDTEYNDISSVPMPGRWFKAGLNISLTKIK